MTDSEDQNGEPWQGTAGFSGTLYLHLRDRLVNHHIRPGQRLDPRWLAEEYKVSAAPVRDAVNRLTGEGLVTHIPSKGYFVRPITVGAMIEAYEMVSVLLRYSVEMGDRPFDSDGLEGVPTFNMAAPGAATANATAASQLSRVVETLFERIAAMTGNSTIVAVTRTFLDLTHHARSRDLRDVAYLAAVLPQIEVLKASLIAGDRDAALGVITELIDEKRKRLPRLVNEIELEAIEMDSLFQGRKDED